MKSSNVFLIKQFFDARDPNKYVYFDEKHEQDFYKWLKQMQGISKYYTDFLEEMKFNFKGSNCAEISKSFFDTVVKPYDTHLITLYENGLNDIGQSRVVEGNLVVNKDIPVIIQASTEKLYSSNEYDVFMTQNPYTQGDLKKLSILHNSCNYDVIAGIFGFNDDKNKSKKINELKRFRDSLYGDYIFEIEKKDGVYCGVVGTKKRIRK